MQFLMLTVLQSVKIPASSPLIIVRFSIKTLLAIMLNAYNLSFPSIITLSALSPIILIPLSTNIFSSYFPAKMNIISPSSASSIAACMLLYL